MAESARGCGRFLTQVWQNLPTIYKVIYKDIFKEKECKKKGRLSRPLSLKNGGSKFDKNKGAAALLLWGFFARACAKLSEYAV